MSERLPLELERVEAVHAGDERVVEAAPAKPAATPGEWIRDNLFSSPFNGVLTIVAGAFAAWALYQVTRFVFVTGDWAVFKANLRSYMVGRFPGEDLWRVWAALYFVVALSGVTWGASGRRLQWTPRKAALRVVLAALALFVLVYLLDSLLVWALVAAAVLVGAGAVAAGRIMRRPVRRVLVIGWVVAFPVVILLLRGFGGVPPRLWGGLLLNILVAVVGIFFSFPIGILLALGRRSTLPVIRTFCVGFIELIRGVPLVTLLIFGQFVLPLFIPQLGLPDILRAMVMFTVFSSAYVAEIVRGGLQGVPGGQIEAGKALGLPATRLMALIVLPQALRSTIPAMISHFISLFKDTSLLAAIGGFTELLRTARRASVGLEFIGDQKEALLPAAFLFWLFAFSMSRWSQRLERRVGVGER